MLCIRHCSMQACARVKQSWLLKSLAVEPVGAWMRSMTPYTLDKTHGARPQLICCCAHMLPLPAWTHVFIYFVFVHVGIVSECCLCTVVSFQIAADLLIKDDCTATNLLLLACLMGH